MPDLAVLKAQGRPHFLMEGVSPEVRRLLVRERIRAMAGHLEETRRVLSTAVAQTPVDRPRDLVALGQLYAELLHLDRRDGEALEEFDKVVMPNLSKLAEEERVGILQNRSDLQQYLSGEGVGLFYNLVDQKRLLNFEWLDYRDLYEAQRDAARGRHYETLPALWRQLRQSYLHGCWSASRWVSRLFAMESIELKEWRDAVHHAIASCDDAATANIVEGIMSANDVDLVGAAVARLLRTANLRWHFAIGCKLLAGLADAIADADVPRVASWLLKRGVEPSFVGFGENHMRVAWETLERLGHRLPEEVARSVAVAATEHPAWVATPENPDQINVDRKAMVRTVTSLVGQLQKDELVRIAGATVTLVTDSPQGYDHADIVRLLCQLAVRGGPDLRDSLAASLYPKGKQQTPILVQVAKVFGKEEAFAATQFNEVAQHVAKEMRRQVQRLKPGEEPERPSELLMEYFNDQGDEKLRVYVVQLSNLCALARHRKKLTPESISILVEAMIDLAKEADNFCANRAGLLGALIEFADCIPASEAGKVVAALEPLARGAILESTRYPTAAESRNPLSPNRAEMGKPEDVQSVALVAIATMAASSRRAAALVGRILEEALCDHRGAIRRAAYDAAGALPRASSVIIVGVLAGLRDPDPNAAAEAFGAIRDQSKWKLTGNHWRILLMSSRLGAQSNSVRLRRRVASTLVALAPRCPTRFKNELSDTLTMLGRDACHSVRSMARRTAAESETPTGEPTLN